MKRFLLSLVLWMLLLAGCQTQPTETASVSIGMGMGPGMGMDPGMMTRHRAPIPEPYTGLTSPALAGDDVLTLGGDMYTLHCISCHGDGGMGDGPTGQVLDPPSAPIAHTSQMMGDDYLFWRISEGGAAFETAMPAWKRTLSEDDIWALIHYVRALGQGQVEPRGPTGAMNDPATQAAQQAETLAQATSQGVITKAEADTFTAVHAALDGYLSANPGTGNAESRRAAGLDALMEAGTLTQVQADTFLDVHDRLMEAGLMR
jgi:mono/diheme cytochrome c family protein